MRWDSLVGFALGGLVLVGCGDGDDPELIDGLFTEAEWATITTFGPLGAVPPDTTNRYADDLAVAELGQSLWFEKRYAGPLTVADDGTNGGLGMLGETERVACADCHQPDTWYSDFRSNPNSRSIGAGLTGRNTPSSVNAAFYTWGNWDGAHDSQWKQGANSPESRDNFNSTRLRYAHVIYDHYRDAYNALFPETLDPALDPLHPEAARFPPVGKPKASASDPDGPWEMMLPADQEHVNRIMTNCGKSLAAYQRRLVSRNNALDRYIGGDFTALTASAKRGLQLFIGKAACDACHEGQTFTDEDFHNTGVMQVVDPLDEGRYTGVLRALNNTFNGASVYSDDPVAGAAKLAGLAQTDDLRGKFRTKSLRHVAMTAPYFHDGSMATLEDVVRFYDAGGGSSGFPGVKDPRIVPLNLTEQEIADLVAFLESLTGDEIPAALRANTAAP
jgi:cytochrome c peroxidase